MKYRGCEITPEYIGFGWHHPDYDGPDDEGNSDLCGHEMTTAACKARIDELYEGGKIS